jgi:hypothetical protein
MQPFDHRPTRGMHPRTSRRLALVTAMLASATFLAACGSTTTPAPSPSGSATAVGPSSSPGTTPTVGPTSGPTATPSPTPVPTPTPAPTPVLVAAPMTGRMVSPAAAARHPIAVMVDDQYNARPQSGFTEASVVWQAPAEGGIPRYMMIFAEGSPKSVGPVRSARLYFVQWASEWKAVYAHVGGSPQAMALLASRGQGQAVYNADQFRYGGTYFWRTKDRFAPHNVYTDSKHLRALAKRVGATAPPHKAVWKFADDAPLAARPKGARIDITYPYNKIGYRYDRATNTWRRYTGGKAQVDRANKKQVAPKNVVIMQVRFGLLGAHQKGRLEAQNIGTGPAWIATNGKVIKGTWKKTSATNPTRFYDSKGKPVVLTRGQTFVQVIPPGTPLKLVKGTPVVAPTPSPSPTPVPAPTPTP